jgi:hypothetical protein
MGIAIFLEVEGAVIIQFTTVYPLAIKDSQTSHMQNVFNHYPSEAQPTGASRPFQNLSNYPKPKSCKFHYSFKSGIGEILARITMREISSVCRPMKSKDHVICFQIPWWNGHGIMVVDSPIPKRRIWKGKGIASY